MSIFRRAASRLALAVALTAGASLTLAAPAHAAKKQEKPAAPKTNYSKGFIEVYQPLAQKIDAGGDLSLVKADFAAAQAAAQTPDDKFALGRVMYKVAASTSDIPLQRQSLALMIDSGSTLIADDKPTLLYAAAELAYRSKDWTAARTLAEQAATAGYNGDTDLLISESLFSEGQMDAGLSRLDQAIAKKIAANEAVPEAWLKRGFGQAYGAKLDAQAAKFANMYAQYYPSQISWSNAIAVQRNINNYDGQELLDLLRLAQRTDALRTERDYVDYISAADARRLPGETQRVIAAGLAAGLIKQNDVFVSEANTVASARARADQADLPNLARDARAAGASGATLMAAGDAFLSYNKAAEAEEFYKLALVKPGADTPRLLTRLGIAQLDLGKTAEAQANFAKVEGARQAIARLWALYAKQADAPASTAAPQGQ